MTDRELALLIACPLRYNRDKSPHYSEATNLFYKTAVQFVADGYGHILKILGIYDKLKQSLAPNLEEWKYRRNREFFAEFLKTVSFRKSSPDYADTWVFTQGRLSHHLQLVYIENDSVYEIRFSSDGQLVDNDLSLNPFWDVHAIGLMSLLPNSRAQNAYITVYQLGSPTVSIYKTRNDVELFTKDILQPTIDSMPTVDLKSSVVNTGCPGCSVRMECDKWKKYLESLGKDQDIVALLLKRSILNGQRQSARDEMYKITQLIMQKIERAGEITQDGIRYFLDPAVKRIFDPYILRDVLKENNAWRDDLLIADASKVEALLRKNPALIAAVQRSIVSSETSYNLRGSTIYESKKRRL